MASVVASSSPIRSRSARVRNVRVRPVQPGLREAARRAGLLRALQHDELPVPPVPVQGLGDCAQGVVAESSLAVATEPDGDQHRVGLGKDGGVRPEGPPLASGTPSRLAWALATAAGETS